MARNQAIVYCEPKVWTQLTNADATEVTFQVQTSDIYVRFTTDTTTPTEARGIQYDEGLGELQKPMTELTSLTNARRVWAKPVGGRRAVVYVDSD